jgi:hypothetical protein
MLSCYDSVNDLFVCELQKIKCLFSEEIYNSYKQQRYGIKTCSGPADPDELSDIRELMEYIMTMDISGLSGNTYRNQIINDLTIEAEVKGKCAPDFMAEALRVCNISKIIEKINTL